MDYLTSLLGFGGTQVTQEIPKPQTPETELQIAIITQNFESVNNIIKTSGYLLNVPVQNIVDANQYSYPILDAICSYIICIQKQKARDQVS